MKIFDIHTHAYPDNIAEKAVDALRNFYELDKLYDLTIDYNGTVGELMAMEKECGSSGFLVFSVATIPEQVEKINNFLANVKNTYSSKDMKIECFAAMHHDYPNKQSEIDRIIKMGMKGVKIHPDFQKIDIDSPLLYPLYEYIEGKIPLYLHVGDERYDYSDSDKVVTIQKRFPKLTIIAAHLGGYQKWHKFKTNYLDSDIYIDTSSALWAMKPKDALDIIRFHGADKVLFGTDYPINSVTGEIAMIDRLNLTDSEREKIFYLNAAKLLEF